MLRNTYVVCNHDIKLYIDLNNYFEIGKHANEFQNKFNDPLYVPKLSKLNDSCDSMVEFISSTCNYYERGRKAYLYASML